MHQKKDEGKGMARGQFMGKAECPRCTFFLKMTRHKRFSKYRSNTDQGAPEKFTMKHLKAFVKKLKSVKIRSQDPALKC